MADQTIKMDPVQFRRLIAAILASGVAASQEKGSSAVSATTYYKQALKKLAEIGLGANNNDED